MLCYYYDPSKSNRETRSIQKCGNQCKVGKIRSLALILKGLKGCESLMADTHFYSKRQQMNTSTLDSRVIQWKSAQIYTNRVMNCHSAWFSTKVNIQLHLHWTKNVDRQCATVANRCIFAEFSIHTLSLFTHSLAFREQLNIAILGLKESGTLDRLKQKWWYEQSECKLLNLKVSRLEP